MEKQKLFFSLLLLWLGHFVVDFMIGIWPVYKTMMGLDLALVGGATVLGVLIGEGMQLFFGAMSDSGYRRLILLGGLLLPISALFYPYPPSFIYVFLLFLFTCIGSGAFHPSAVSVVTGLSKKRRGLFMTIFASGGMMGMACSQIIFSSTYSYFSGNTAILMIPPLALFLIVFLSGFMAQEKQSQASERRSMNFHAIRSFFHNRDLVNLYFLQVANQSIFWGLVFLLPDHFTSRGAPEWMALGGGHFSLIMGCASMMIPGGYFADKYSHKNVLFLSTIVALTTFYLFLFIPGLSSLATIVILFVLGASLGICNPVSVAFGNSLMPENPGVVSATLMGLVWVVAEGLGPGGAGFMTKLFSYDAPAKTLAILGFFFLVAIYIIPKLPKVSEVEEELVTL